MGVNLIYIYLAYSTEVTLSRQTSTISANGDAISIAGSEILVSEIQQLLAEKDAKYESLNKDVLLLGSEVLKLRDELSRVGWSILSVLPSKF